MARVPVVTAVRAMVRVHTVAVVSVDFVVLVPGHTHAGGTG
jgi:hypothetical protein